MPASDYSVKENGLVYANDHSHIIGRSEMDEIVRLGEVFARARMNKRLAFAAKQQTEKAYEARCQEAADAERALEAAIEGRVKGIVARNGSLFTEEVTR